VGVMTLTTGASILTIGEFKMLRGMMRQESKGKPHRRSAACAPISDFN
jgi:hypothetical protein